jgi:GWxTD domain-containing protein
MKKMILLVFILFYPFLSFSIQKNLPPEHKDWLEMVSPIITKIEREIFLKLKDSRERNRFIEVFWKQRDPLPDTSENEFLKEYKERIKFADFEFGRQSSRKGSQTERGFFYLLLGPPLDRQMYATHSDLYPLELWHYKGESEYGLPSFFYLIFYQPAEIGEYRLYSPGIEGPERLVSPARQSLGISRAEAHRLIKQISGELAGASLSYLPGSASIGTSSFSSDTILASIHSLPEKKFTDSYARNFIYYQDYVETDYTHNFIDSNHKIRIFKNEDHFYLHWALEPSQINFAFYNDQYYSSFQLVIRIEDGEGNLVLEKEEEIPLQVSPENYKQYERKLFAFQDILPIIPGNYKFFFLLKNKTAKDFTSFQTDVLVPRDKGGPFLSNLLLYQDAKAIQESQRKKLKAFTFDGNQYINNAQNNFHPDRDVGIYCQVYNIEDKNEKSVQYEIFSVNSDTALHSFRKPLEEAMAEDGQGMNLGIIPLSSFKSGYYRVEVSILDQDELKILNERGNFILLSQPFPIVPWSYAKLHDPMPNLDHLYTFAVEHFMVKNFTEAQRFLRDALAIKDEYRSRLLLGKTLYAIGQHQESLVIVSPIYEQNEDREAAKILAVNHASLKDWSSALIYLEKLLEQAAEISVLNLAAECYVNLGQHEQALPLIQKSLELNPQQENIKELEARIKKQRKLI